MTIPATTGELLAVPEVMQRLELGRSTVYDPARSRRPVPTSIGRARRVPADAVRDVIVHGTGGGGLMPKRIPSGEGAVYRREDGRCEGAGCVLMPGGTHKWRRVCGKSWGRRGGS